MNRVFLIFYSETKEQSQKCEGVIIEEKLLKALKKGLTIKPLETTEQQRNFTKHFGMT